MQLMQLIDLKMLTLLDSVGVAMDALPRLPGPRPAPLIWSGSQTPDWS